MIIVEVENIGGLIGRHRFEFREISIRWREVMKDPEWWERIPWVGITCLAIAIASLIAPILTW